MSIIANFTTASEWIPATIKIGKLHSTSTYIARYEILKEYESLLDIFKGILFYSYLFENIDTTIYYDDFSYIPMMREEVESFAYFGNSLNRSIIRNKLILYPNQFQLKLIS